MVCMSDDDLARKVLAERLRLAAGWCQTVAIGVLLLGFVTPLLTASQKLGGAAWDNLAMSVFIAAGLTLYAHKLIGDAVKAAP